MNQNNDSPDRDFADPEISATYRSMTDVSPPEKLDAAVLREARVAAGRRRTVFGVSGWLRPAAFVATVGLSLAILLEFSEIRTFDPVSQISPEPDTAYRPAAGGSDRMQLRDDDQGQESRQVPATESSVTEAIVPATASGTARGQKDGFANSSLRSDQQLDAPAAAPGTVGDTADLDSSGRQPGRKSLPAAAVGAAEVGVAQYCDDEQIGSAESWWQCIDALREANELEAARHELELFNAAYPDFQPAR